jgi:hypothetical protein
MGVYLRHGHLLGSCSRSKQSNIRYNTPQDHEDLVNILTPFLHLFVPVMKKIKGTWASLA